MAVSILSKAGYEVIASTGKEDSRDYLLKLGAADVVDREFINEVVTSTLVFEGRGRVVEYVGGYDDWLTQRKSSKETQRRTKVVNNTASQSPAPRPRKRTFKERKELERLPHQIETLEKEQETLHRQMSDTAYYRSPPETISANALRAKQIPEELEQAYARWAEIEEQAP